MTDLNEKITVDGVKGEYLKFDRDGLTFKYWCDLCESKPAITQGFVAMVLRHDACFSHQLVEASKRFEAPKVN